MIAAVMQPYLFPYIGYYQLAGAVDHLVFLDDVTFIKQGWINRNQVLVNGEASMFTVPNFSRRSTSTIDMHRTGFQ